MKRIGLTGGIACGKSEVAGYLRVLGAKVSDADAFSRASTAEGGAAVEAIRDIFGLSYFDGDGRLNRRRLGISVFSDAVLKLRLESIIHPIVMNDMECELAAFKAMGCKVAFLDIPLLYETGMEVLCDKVWVVAASRDTQIKRIIQRDGLTRGEAIARIDSQLSIKEKISRADEVICNDGDLAMLRKKVDQLYRRILDTDVP